MKAAQRIQGLAVVTFTSMATIFSASSFAGPKIRAPGQMSKRPQPPVPSGFDVGPDAMANYQVDSTSQRNEVVFTSKAPKETITGKTAKVTGNLELNPKKFDSVSGKFTVAWKDLDTGNPMRNQHMMSKEQGWVDAKTFPDIVFTVTQFELPKTPVKSSKGGEHSIKGKLVGKFAMNGKEKDMKIPATLVYIEAGKGEGSDPVKEGIGVKAKFAVALADFDINGRGIGEKVAKKQQINVSLFLSKAEGSAAGKADQDKKASDDEGKKTSKKKDKKHKKDDESKES